MAGKSKSVKVSQAGVSNTALTTYLDTFNTATECQDDKENVEKKCKSKTEKEKDEYKKRKTGLATVVRDTLKKADDVGKKLYSYNKGSNQADGKPAKNAWMDDHCDGMWVKPQFNGIDDAKFTQQLQDQKKEFEKLGNTLESYSKHPDKLLEAGFESLSRQAIDTLGADKVEGLLLKKFGRDAALAALPTKGGALLKTLATVAKTGISGASYLEFGQTLAGALGTDSAKEIMHGMKYMAGDGAKRMEEALKVWQEKPDAAMAEMMSLNAEVNPCLRARKCQLVPYSANEKKNNNGGAGCCPGQTAHHVIPDAAAKNAGCKDYKYQDAPTICLEGQDNTYGTHGRAHTKLKALTTEYNGGPKIPPKAILYNEMRDKALLSIGDSIEQCNKECLKKQLDSYYQKCGEMVAHPGTPGIPKPHDETQNNTTPDRA